MTNVEKFIHLQNKANEEIETLGQATTETVVELDKVGDSLTNDEITEVIHIYDVVNNEKKHLHNTKR